MTVNKSPKILLVCLLVATMLAGCHEPEGAGDHDDGMPQTNGGDDQEELVIGSLMPLTGDVATLGVPAAQGARLAVQEINDAGGVDGKRLVLVEGDTQFPKTQEAVSEFQRLAGEGVQYIVGALASDSTAAVKERSNEAGVVLVSPSSTRPSLTGPDHGHFFRVIANDSVQGPQAARLLYEDLGQDSTVVMFQQTGYAEGLKDTFVPAFEELGGTINGAPIAWTNDEATFDSKAAEAAARNPQFVWMSGQAPEIGNLIHALRNQGYDGQILASEAIEGEQIFDIEGDDMDGVLFTKAAPDVNSERYQAFEDAYRADYDDASPGPFDAFAYDAVYVGVAAIQAVGNDGDAIRDWMESNSVSGRVTTDTIAFNSNGDVTTGGYTLWEITEQGGQGDFRPYSG